MEWDVDSKYPMTKVLLIMPDLVIWWFRSPTLKETGLSSGKVTTNRRRRVGSRGGRTRIINLRRLHPGHLPCLRFNPLNVRRLHLLPLPTMTIYHHGRRRRHPSLQEQGHSHLHLRARKNCHSTPDSTWTRLKRLLRIRSVIPTRSPYLHPSEQGTRRRTSHRLHPTLT